MTIQFAVEIVEPFQFMLCVVVIGLFWVMITAIKYMVFFQFCHDIFAEDDVEIIDQNGEERRDRIKENED